MDIRKDPPSYTAYETAAAPLLSTDFFFSQLHQAALALSANTLELFFTYHDTPPSLLRDCKNWNLPFTLIINNLTNQLEILLKNGLPPSVCANQLEGGGPWMTELNLLSIALLENNETAVKLILSYLPENITATEYEDLFPYAGDAPTAADITKQLYIYDPQNPSSPKNYSSFQSIDIDENALFQAFNHSNEEGELALTPYQVARICKSPLLPILEEAGYTPGKHAFDTPV